MTGNGTTRVVGFDPWPLIGLTTLALSAVIVLKVALWLIK